MLILCLGLRDYESTKTAQYKRVLLKLSGEALMGSKNFGIDQKVVQYISKELKGIANLEVQVAIVIGGGNIFRGLEASAEGMERTSADYMGMLATALNALALQNALEVNGMPTRVLSAIEMRELAEPYIRRRAMRHLEKGKTYYICMRYRQPLFYYGYGSGFKGHGNRGRHYIEGNKSRWYLHQ